MLWVFLCLAAFHKAFFYLWCTTKSLLLKTVFFPSPQLRVGTPLILKVEIITWSCSFCFFLYNFSSYPSIKKTKIQITTLLMESSTPPSPHSRKILSLPGYFEFRCSFLLFLELWHYIILPFVHFYAWLVAPWVRFPFQRCGFESPSGSGQKVEYVPCPCECPNICIIWHRVGNTIIFAFRGT